MELYLGLVEVSYVILHTAPPQPCMLWCRPGGRRLEPSPARSRRTESKGTWRKPRMPLQREAVARAALRLLDEVGLDGLTVRRLAADLNIQNSSLYWHFTNKQELLNCMAEVIVADAFADLRPPDPDQDWATWLAGFARVLRRMTLAHRDGARTLAEADLTFSPFVRGVELAARVLLDAGFEARTALASGITILKYVLGGAFELQTDPTSNPLVRREDSALPEPPFVDPEQFPTLAGLLNQTDRSPTSPEAWFEEGLRLLLDGMRVALARETQQREHRHNR
jgi:TetR/AcrR family transcriptional regulator, tetracycline repressor protein